MDDDDLPAFPLEPATDPFIVRAVVVFLGVTILAALGVGAWLANNDTDPAVVATVAVTPGTTALGALSAVLVSTRVRR